MLFTSVHRLPNGLEQKRKIILKLPNLIDRDDIYTAATKVDYWMWIPYSLALRRGELIAERSKMSSGENVLYFFFMYHNACFFVKIKNKLQKSMTWILRHTFSTILELNRQFVYK